jgi:hypothetical protein
MPEKGSFPKWESGIARHNRVVGLNHNQANLPPAAFAAAYLENAALLKPKHQQGCALSES